MHKLINKVVLGHRVFLQFTLLVAKVPPTVKQIQKYMRSHYNGEQGYIFAIKAVRDITGWSLKQSKFHVDLLSKEMETTTGDKYKWYTEDDNGTIHS